MTASGIKIIGTGSYLPKRILSNDDLEKMVDTNAEWIYTRSGIKERRIAGEDESCSVLGAEAVKAALKQANIQAEEIDLIITATISPDKIFPNTSCFIQNHIGAFNAACFSVEAACTGFSYILEIAASMLRFGNFKTAAVVGSEKLSSFINWKDRRTCVLFGDGAGAVLLQSCPLEENCYIKGLLGANGEFSDILHIPSGGSRQPFSSQVLKDESYFLTMSGKEVFKHAIHTMSSVAHDILEATNVSKNELRWVIPHQANIRIIHGMLKNLNIPAEKAVINLHKYGNTSAASIPIALDEMVRKKQIKQGDYILIVAFGGGITWGANLICWRSSTH